MSGANFEVQHLMIHFFPGVSENETSVKDQMLWILEVQVVHSIRVCQFIHNNNKKIENESVKIINVV